MFHHQTEQCGQTVLAVIRYFNYHRNMETTICLPSPLGCFDLPESRRSGNIPDSANDLSDDFVFADRDDCVACDDEGDD